MSHQSVKSIWSFISRLLSAGKIKWIRISEENNREWNTYEYTEMEYPGEFLENIIVFKGQAQRRKGEEDEKEGCVKSGSGEQIGDEGRAVKYKQAVIQSYLSILECLLICTSISIENFKHSRWQILEALFKNYFTRIIEDGLLE